VGEVPEVRGKQVSDHWQHSIKRFAIQGGMLPLEYAAQLVAGWYARQGKYTPDVERHLSDALETMTGEKRIIVPKTETTETPTAPRKRGRKPKQPPTMTVWRAMELFDALDAQKQAIFDQLSPGDQERIARLVDAFKPDSGNGGGAGAPGTGG
jgi:hypothetical protein